MASKGRVAIVTLQSKSAEDDPEYQRVVRELQDNAHGPGFLGGAGAMNRQDLQYMADLQKAELAADQETKYQEASEFSKLRCKLESENAGDMPNQQGTLRVALREKKDLRPAAKLLPAVKVSPRDPLAALLEGGEPPLKRTRIAESDGRTLASPSALGARTGSGQAGALGVGGEGPVAVAEAEEGEGEEEGLQGLGGYSSEEEAPAVKPKSLLPNAADLFREEDEAERVAAAALKTREEAAEAAARMSSEDSSED